MQKYRYCEFEVVNSCKRCKWFILYLEKSNVNVIREFLSLDGQATLKATQGMYWCLPTSPRGRVWPMADFYVGRFRARSLRINGVGFVSFPRRDSALRYRLIRVPLRPKAERLTSTVFGNPKIWRTLVMYLFFLKKEKKRGLHIIREENWI